MSSGAETDYEPGGDPFLRSLYRMENCIHPGSFFLRLDARCNQDCDFCNILEEGGSTFSSSATYVKQMLHQIVSLRPSGAVVNFTGGEPTLRRDLVMLVAYAKHVGISRVVLQTNAIRFSSERYLDAMRRAGLDDCLVSFHSHLPEIQERMTRAPGTFAPQHEGIERLLAAGVPITLNTVVTRDNLATVGETMDYVATTFPGVRGVILSPPQPHGRLLLRMEKMPSYTELRAPIRDAAERLLTAGIPFHLAHNENPLCWVLSVFDVPGTPEVRRFIRKGLEKRGCTTCHLSHTMDKDKVKTDACGSCYLQDVCFGVWRRYVEHFGQGEIRPFPFPAGGRRLARSVSSAPRLDEPAGAFRGVAVR